ncbi:Uncharacterised protein [Klebsiella pneumoniae]|nr:Uncharacterised protein [Klebsiella pneumoniae]
MREVCDEKTFNHHSAGGNVGLWYGLRGGCRDSLG